MLQQNIIIIINFKDKCKSKQKLLECEKYLRIYNNNKEEIFMSNNQREMAFAELDKEINENIHQVDTISKHF